MPNVYYFLGIPLAIVGGCLAPLSYYFLESIPLTATGISILILGLTVISLAEAEPKAASEACRTLIDTAMKHNAPALKKLDTKNKAIYLPRKMTNGYSHAIIPLDGQNNFHELLTASSSHRIPENSPHLEEGALVLTTTGNISLGLLNRKPGNSTMEIRLAMQHILVEVLDMATGASVDLQDSRLNIEVTGARVMDKDPVINQCLGSPIASIAAAISSEALEKPVRILEESCQKKTSKIVIEVLS
jgi:hypothetical protein